MEVPSCRDIGNIFNKSPQTAMLTQRRQPGGKSKASCFKIDGDGVVMVVVVRKPYSPLKPRSLDR